MHETTIEQPAMSCTVVAAFPGWMHCCGEAFAFLMSIACTIGEVVGETAPSSIGTADCVTSDKLNDGLVASVACAVSPNASMQPGLERVGQVVCGLASAPFRVGAVSGRVVGALVCGISGRIGVAAASGDAVAVAVAVAAAVAVAVAVAAMSVEIEV